MTREQFAQVAIENLKLLQDKYNLFLGCEYGDDYAAAYSQYAHGMMTEKV